MPRQLASARSVTAGLLVALAVTLAAVVAYSLYVTRQISGLRELQTSITERNRMDSLQLLRIQNTLNSIALGMRDVLDNTEHYPVKAFQGQFQRLRTDLEDGMKREQAGSVATRTAEQHQYLESSVPQLWEALDHDFDLSRDGKEQGGRLQHSRALHTSCGE